MPRGTKTQIILPDEDFEIVSAALRFADIRNSDFEAVIDEAAAGDLVFADPPYTVAHNMNGFVKYNQRIFSWDDQVRLRDALLRAAKRGCSIVLSNADHESVRTLYESFGSVEAVTRASVIAGNARVAAPKADIPSSRPQEDRPLSLPGVRPTHRVRAARPIPARAAHGRSRTSTANCPLPEDLAPSLVVGDRPSSSLHS